jgi:hypothetical protein
MLNGGYMIDQPSKRNYYNYAGRNSDYSVKFEYSCNFKDIHNILLSCDCCKIHLSNGIDVDSYQDYYNWEFMNATYSLECVTNNGGSATRLCKLTMKLEQEKCCEIYDQIVNGKLNRSNAMKMMKPYNYSGDTIKLILDNIFAEYN